MIGDSKPNFALDLSNDGIALWHRKGGAGWTALGTVKLDDPDFSAQVKALRDSVSKGSSAKSRARRTSVRIPRSEVLLSKVRVGVFEGEAAQRHAYKQIAELSPYPIEDIAYDLGDKGFGNMAPVGIVARQTLIEAEDFARTHGFDPIYFTTQYTDKDFPREPRFYLAEEHRAAKPLWFVPWIAAAAVGMSVGYFGYSYLTQPNSLQPTEIAAIEQPATIEPDQEPTTEPATVTAAVTETEVEPDATATIAPKTTVQLGLQDIAPNLPPVLVALNAPDVTDYPELLTRSVGRNISTDTPGVIRLKTATSDEPQVIQSSELIKTNSLQIAEARRDLPEVSVNQDVARLIQNDLAIGLLTQPDPARPIVLAALTSPTQAFDPVLLSRLPAGGDSKTGVSDAATQTAERPPPPPSTVFAEPGTLIPTPEGTLGPENILIFSGRPPNVPLDRPGSVLPPDPLTGFKPRLRPDTLVVPEIVAQADPTAEPEPLSILDLADPTLRPLRARLRPDGLVPAPQASQEAPEQPLVALATAALNEGPAQSAQIATPDVAIALSETAQPEQPVTAALDSGAAATNAATSESAIGTAETVATASILSLADPTLRPLRARIRPANLVPADQIAALSEPATDTVENTSGASISITEAALQESVQEALAQASVLALADPALRPFRARNRPSDLVVLAPSPAAPGETTDALTETTTQDAPTLLALADPSLAGRKARNRPGNLRVLSDVDIRGLLALADPSLANKRSRVRPRKLRIIQPPKPEPAAVEEPTTEPAAKPDNTLSSATKLAIARSPKPKTRPARLARVVKRVTAEPKISGGSTRATAKLPRSAVGTVKSAPGATATTVARAATEKSKFKKSRMSLVGVFGTPNARRALVRLSSGRYVKVQAGDRLSGWSVSAIGESSLRIRKGSRDQVLRMP